MSSDVGRRLNAITRRYFISNNPPNLGDVDIHSTPITLAVSPERPTMTVKIDRVEPNIFPPVDDLDARDAGRNVEVFLDVSVEGRSTPVTVKLSYEQASDLAILLEPFRKPRT
jgi:hypothetical protein